MLDVIMSLGETVFQSSEVNGAVCSGVLEFDKSAKGVSFCGGGSRVFTVEDRVIVELTGVDEEDGSDHNRRWSPEVASRSVDCF
jgi:hypothetical protein